MVTGKRVVRFETVEEMMADVRMLRKGHRRVGNWTLGQVAWHLNVAMGRSMMAGPHAAVVVGTEVKERLAKILAGEPLPQIEAPAAAVPPVDAGEEAVEEMLATAERLKGFAGPFAPHRLFGEIPAEDFLRLHLRHAAHHLGHLVPTGGEA